MSPDSKKVFSPAACVPARPSARCAPSASRPMAPRRAGRRAEGAVGRGGVPEAVMRRHHRHADAHRDLVARDQRRDQVAARRAPRVCGQRQRRRHHHRADMQQGALVRVVIVGGVDQDAVGERREGRLRRNPGRADDAGTGPSPGRVPRCRARCAPSRGSSDQAATAQPTASSRTRQACIMTSGGRSAGRSVATKSASARVVMGIPPILWLGCGNRSDRCGAWPWSPCRARGAPSGPWLTPWRCRCQHRGRWRSEAMRKPGPHALRPRRPQPGPAMPVPVMLDGSHV